jgi:small subunit ribosomal protein S27Ae
MIFGYLNLKNKNLNMAKDKGGGGKKPHKNKPTSKKYTKYKIEGDKIIRERSCPRCGTGVFLMKADNRLYCGKCHYTEFSKK